MLTHVRPEDFDPDRYKPDGILGEIAAFCRTLPSGSVIAFHGWPGSGKTPTARWLGDQLGLPVVHLDEISGPEGVGFDEEAARVRIAADRAEGTVIVAGMCAARVCAPDVLIRMGLWPGHSLSQSARAFMKDYDARDYTGAVKSFEAYDAGV